MANSVCSIITDNWLKKSLGLFLTESIKVGLKTADYCEVKEN